MKLLGFPVMSQDEPISPEDFLKNRFNPLAKMGAAEIIKYFEVLVDVELTPTKYEFAKQKIEWQLSNEPNSTIKMVLDMLEVESDLTTFAIECKKQLGMDNVRIERSKLH